MSQPREQSTVSWGVLTITSSNRLEEVLRTRGIPVIFLNSLMSDQYL
jgi:rRNA-processing protein FCF1